MLSFTQSAAVLAAAPRVRDDAGRVALRRGPLVYCVEDADHDVPVESLAVDAGSFDPEPEHDPDLFGGTTVLRGRGTSTDFEAWTDSLYRSVDAVERTEIDVVAVPYYAWDNREAGSMTVWIPTS
jgi:DUF1680 family protein